MHYPDGQEIRLGDLMRIWGTSYGLVVCSVDTDEYSEDYPKHIWQAFLESGILIFTREMGDVHYLCDADAESFELLQRGVFRRDQMPIGE